MYIKNIKLSLLLTMLYVSIPILSLIEEACRSVFNGLYDMVSVLREDILGSKEAFDELNWIR